MLSDNINEFKSSVSDRKMAATEVKLSPDHSVSSSASSPESTHGDAPIDNPSNGADGNGVVVQKRKGGRKPVYATQEERKMRNRAAQAGKKPAFSQVSRMELSIGGRKIYTKEWIPAKI